jgi:hypothetical protein
VTNIACTSTSTSFGCVSHTPTPKLVLTISETSTQWARFKRFKWQELNDLVSKNKLVFVGWPITNRYPGSCADEPGIPSSIKNLPVEDVNIVVHKQNEDLNPNASQGDLVMDFMDIGMWSIGARTVPLIAYLDELWVTPEGRITTTAPDDDREAALPDEEKTISLRLIPPLDRPTIVSHTGEVIVFSRDLPSAASAILRAKAAKALKEIAEDPVDDTEDAVEKEKKGKGKETVDSCEFKSF